MEATTPAAAKVGEATKGNCLKASMSSSKRQGEESTRLLDRILKLENVDGAEQEFQASISQIRQPVRLRPNCHKD